MWNVFIRKQQLGGDWKAQEISNRVQSLLPPGCQFQIWPCHYWSEEVITVWQMFGCLYRSDLVRLVNFFVKRYVPTRTHKKIFISTLLVVLAVSVRTGQAYLCIIRMEGLLSHVKVDWNIFKAPHDVLWNFEVDCMLHNLKLILLRIFATLWSTWDSL